MNAASKKAILKVYKAIQDKIDALEKEMASMEYGTCEYRDRQQYIYGLRSQLNGMDTVLTLTAPDSGPMKGFGLRVKNGEIVRRHGALTADDIIQFI